MKTNIIYGVMFSAALCLASCDEDRDSNPTFQDPTALVLNTPAVAVNNVIDLQNSKNVVLTTSQPDYGFTASTSYSVFMGLDGENFVKLPTAYTTARMEVPAAEINNAVLEIAGDADLSVATPLYFQISASIFGQDDLGFIESNVVKLPNVLAYVPTVEIDLPSSLYMVGDFAASNGWSDFVPMHAAFSQDGFFYGLVYLAQGNNFKFSLKPAWGTDFGFSGMSYDGEVASATTSSDDGNAVFGGESGWYTVILRAKIANGALSYTLSFREPSVYLVGVATGLGDNGWGFVEGQKFTAPADANGVWVSPDFAGAGELRMAIDCGIDWWKTEFTLDGDLNIYYRNCDIPSNWAENVGEAYSKKVAVGGHVELNFTTGAGELK